MENNYFFKRGTLYSGFKGRENCIILSFLELNEYKKKIFSEAT